MTRVPILNGYPMFSLEDQPAGCGPYCACTVGLSGYEMRPPTPGVSEEDCREIARDSWLERAADRATELEGR